MLAALLVAAAMAQQPRELKLIQELRIDGHEEDFVPIGWIGVRRDGVIAISQTQDARYLFFDASGRRIGEFGKKGSGPREFRWAPHASFIGDSLAAIDYDLKRITI